MRRNLYFYAFGALTLLAGGGLAGYSALADSPEVTHQAPRAIGQTPLAPTLEAAFEFELETSDCFNSINITAPLKARGDDWINRPVEKWDRIELYRSAGDDVDELLKSWDDVEAGAIIEFQDRDGLTFGGDYTYSAKAILDGRTGDAASTEIVYGINPVAPSSPELEAEDALNGPVKVSYSCGAASYGDTWNPMPFPAGIKYTEIRLYKLDADGNTVLLDSHQTPQPGEKFTFNDDAPHAGTNSYRVYTYTQFGESEAGRASIFLGEDTPGKVTDVTAVETGGTVTVTWKAPETGYHDGYIDPSKLVYKIYRSDNDYFRNPTLLADAVTECRFVDKLEGLTEEATLFYRVYPDNGVPFEDVGYNYGETSYGVVAGPPSQLPFIENFNAGNKFNRQTQNKWEEDFGYGFSAHYLRDNVTVENSGEEQEITCGVDGPGNEETGPDNFYYVTTNPYSSSTEAGTLTSANLSFENTYNPILSFSYVPVAGSNGCLTLQMTTGEFDENGYPVYETVHTQPYGVLPSGEEAEAGAKMGWEKVSLPLTSFAGLHASKLRLSFNYEGSEGRFPMLLDQVEINDYPGVTDLTATPDEEGRILISWDLPESAAGKEVIFKILLDGEVIAETGETSYIFEGTEQGESYSFSVETEYADGFETPVAEAEPVVIPITDFTLEGLYYVVDGEETVSLHSYTGNAAEVVIPAEVEFKGATFKVDYMLPMMFQGNRSLKSIELHAALDRIPEKTLYGCVGLESVKITSQIDEIGSHAFFGCTSLKEIELPASTRVIDYSAFENCLKLEHIEFGEALEEIGDAAFKRCQALSKVTFATVVPPVVGKDAFSGVAEGCIGICPSGSEEAYKAVEALNPIEFPATGVASISTGEAVEIEYYTTSGIRLKAPVAGEAVIILKRMADGTVKIEKILNR